MSKSVMVKGKKIRRLIYLLITHTYKNIQKIEKERRLRTKQY